MTNRPCLGCGELIASGSRCSGCRLPSAPKPRQRGRKGRSTSDWTWRKLSERIRRQSPFCELCGSTEDLTCGHIIPISDPRGAELVHDVANLRTECRTCGSRRGSACPPQERARVEQAIEQRRQRQARMSRSH